MTTSSSRLTCSRTTWPRSIVDDAPRLVHNPDGSDTWQFRDIVIPNVALNAVAGRPKEEYGLEPQGSTRSGPAATTSTSASRT